MITIDFRDKRPIYEQLVDKIEELVSRGYYTAGQALPSVRQLALELSINPNTIQRAYSELERRGIIVITKGRGSFITEDVQKLVNGKKTSLMNELRELLAKMKQVGFTIAEITDIVSTEMK